MLKNKQFIIVVLVIFFISLFLNIFYYLKKPIVKQVISETNAIMLTIIPFLDKCKPNYTYSEAPPQLFLSAVRKQKIILTGIGPQTFSDYFTVYIYGNTYQFEFDMKTNKQDLLTYLQLIKNKYYSPVNLRSDTSTCTLDHEFFITDLSSQSDR